jgi:hypothetical protein
VDEAPLVLSVEGGGGEKGRWFCCWEKSALVLSVREGCYEVVVGCAARLVHRFLVNIGKGDVTEKNPTLIGNNVQGVDLCLILGPPNLFEMTSFIVLVTKTNASNCLCSKT